MTEQRRRIGGYIDRDHLDSVIAANASMTAIMLELVQRNENLPNALAVPLLRVSTHLADQARHLREMSSIRHVYERGEQ